MPLTIDISIDTISSDRTTATMVDDTVYGTRANFGTYVVVEKINADSTIESTIVATGDAADPYSDVSWEFTIPNDGWFRVHFVAAEAYSAGTTYDADDVVDDGAGTLYQSQVGSNLGNALVGNPSKWLEVTADDVADLDAASFNSGGSTVYEFILTPNSEYSYASKIAEGAETYLTSTKIPQDILDTYSLLAILLNGAYVYSDRGSYSAGERVCRKLESIIESLG